MQIKQNHLKTSKAAVLCIIQRIYTLTDKQIVKTNQFPPVVQNKTRYEKLVMLSSRLTGTEQNRKYHFTSTSIAK